MNRTARPSTTDASAEPDPATPRRSRAARLRARLALLLATCTMATVLALAGAPAPAGALTPAQTTSTGTVNTLIPDLHNFWRASMTGWGWGGYYRTPQVYFFNTNINACGKVLTPGNAYACSGAYLGQIYVGTSWTQGYLNAYGDYAPGVILAHEWGHQIMYDMNWRGRTNRGSELFADCLAGMYTRYGLTVSRKLNNADYWEGYHTLRALASPTTHGTAQERGAWYEYGYTQYNINSCRVALNH